MHAPYAPRHDAALQKEQRNAAFLVKDRVVERNTPKKISKLEFGVLPAREIMRLSHINVVNRELYQLPSRRPTPNGCLDARLGTSDRLGTCATCGLSLAECAGHFGFTALELPVFHIGYFRAVLTVLQCICKACSRVLLAEDERVRFLRLVRQTGLEAIQRQRIEKRVFEKCKRVVVCPWCGEANGAVKRVGAMKIRHEIHRQKSAALDEFLHEFDAAVLQNEELREVLGNVQDDLNPLRVQRLFERMIKDDLEILDIRGPPEHMLITHMLVPPVCIRPSVTMDATSGSNEDDLTMKLTEIIHINQIMRTALQKGATIQNIMEDWDYLQLHCAMYINSELPGLPAVLQSSSKPLRGLCQRLKGKMGRFRGNLSGKRVDFSSRTVITPDPNLRVDEVGIPRYVANTLTYPERAHDRNIEALRELIRAGPNGEPGANFVEFADGGKRFLRYGDRDRIAQQLRLGDVVERHLRDGDVVLFNRQPSLHKMSIMAHRVRVMPHRTFRFNECVCTPYNADFDGDEMNLHVPQTEEARAEAALLMAVHDNLVTPRNGEPIVAAIQDMITAGHLLTRKDQFYDRAEFSLICSYAWGAAARVELPPPALLKPLELWTGKQIISTMLKPTRDDALLCTFECPGRGYSGSGLHMCPQDGYTCFRNCELISGILDKKALGSGAKPSLFHVILRDNSPAAAADCMSRLSCLCTRWLTNHGFSIGLDDVTPSDELTATKTRIVRDGYDRCDEHIRAFKSGKLQPQPGCDAEQTVEAMVTGVLSNIREEAGQACMRSLTRNNAPYIMARSGAKGSTINISQMVACVGQQTLGGQRIPNGFVGRSLPHFGIGAKEPAAKGFVQSSFFTGLLPTEFFFHTMGGREGLVDTAVKTAETGYMQRRLMKALEDVSVQYDGTVRNSTGCVVQFAFGEDGLDPAMMETDGRPVDFRRLVATCAARPQVAAAARGPPTSRKVKRRRVGGAESVQQRLEEWKRSGQFSGCVDLFVQEMDAAFAPDAPAGRAAAELTRDQLDWVFGECVRRYRAALIQPGEAVGAVSAQSIGEPATQMTLKTFHFAGIASMNVTLGVPRIREIVNAARSISTPIVTARLLRSDDVDAVRSVKGHIEKTTLGQIANIDVVYAPTESYIKVTLDVTVLAALGLGIGIGSVRSAILAAPRLKIKPRHVRLKGRRAILVSPPEHPDRAPFFMLQLLKAMLPRVVVAGSESVSRAVISETGERAHELLVEGTDLLAVMAAEGVDGLHTTSNHILEVERCLGIEAARTVIASEIRYTMESHGITVDPRHVNLLADLMCFKGEVLGITRFGISKMKDSVLMLASFERTTDHLFDAAVHGRCDEIAGVSERIIMGVPMNVGTGCVRLLQMAPRQPLAPRRPLLLDQWQRLCDLG